MFFKVGTYWVYQDSTSGALDSEWVYSSTDGFDTIRESYPSLPAGIYEWFKFRTYSNYGPVNEIYYEVSMTFSSPNRSRVFRFKDAAETICMTSLFIDGDINYPPPQGSVVTCKGTIGDMIILNHSYRNVVKFNDSKNITEKNNNTNFYFAEHSGIIRKELIDSARVWNLKQFQIVQ